MTREQAINYLFSSGFTNEQVCEVVRALTYEPTPKNDLALIHTEGLDEEIRCTMCTNYMKSDRGCDGSCVVDKNMYKAVMDAIEKRIQPTTKNDLGVDCIDRAEVLKLMKDNWHTHNGDWAMQESMDDIRALPSVTPQLSVPEVTALAEWTEKLTKECEEAYNKGYADGVKSVNICPNCGEYIGEEE